MIFYFVSVHYNTSKPVKSYLESIQKLRINDFDSIEVIIVDNKSNKEELENLKNIISQFSALNIKLIESDSNRGYFKGLNLGFDHIKDKENEGRYFLTGNNDVLYEDNFLQNLTGSSYDKDVLVIAPNIKNSSGFYENPHELKRIAKSRMFIYDLYYSNYYFGKFFLFMHNLIGNKIIFRKRIDNRFQEPLEPLDIYMCVGSQFILTPEYFKRCKKLSEDVFLWCEEALLGHQVNEVNGKMIYRPNIKMFHLEHLTTNQFPTRVKYEMMRKSYKIARKFF